MGSRLAHPGPGRGPFVGRTEARALFSSLVDEARAGHGGLLLSGQELIRAWLGLAVEVPIALRLAPASYTELVVNRWGEREIAHLSLTIPVTQPGHR